MAAWTGGTRPPKTDPAHPGRGPRGRPPGFPVRDNPGDPGHGTSPYTGTKHQRNMQRFATMSVRQKQSFLVNKGYHVKVDGVMGPETHAAARAWKRGRTSQQWNTNYHGHPNPGKSGGGSGSGSGGGSGSGLHLGGGGGGGGNQGGGGSGASGGGFPTTQALKKQAGKYASAATRAAYRPAIRQQQRQTQLDAAQEAQNLQDLGSWYGDLNQQANQSEAAQAAQSAHTLSDFNSTAQNIGNAFGFDSEQGNGYQAGQGAQIMSGLLSAQGQAQQDYGSNMKNAYAAQGVDARTDEQRYASQLAENNSAKLSDLQQRRADAAIANRLQAMGQLSQIAAARTNAQATAAMSGLDRQLKQESLKSARLQNAADMYTLQHLISGKARTHRGGVRLGKVPWPDVTDHLNSTISAGNGQLRFRPEAAAAQLRSRMKNIVGVNNMSNAHTQRAISAAFLQAYQTNNKKWTDLGYSWHNGFIWSPSGQKIIHIVQ